MSDTDASVRTLERPAKLVPAVVGALVERLHLGEWAPGQLLPKEADLCAQYGVSRTVIREALRVLEEKGLVGIRQGTGTVVNSADAWNLLDPLVMAAQIRHDPQVTEKREQLMQVRAAMEAEMARAAALRMRQADRSRLAEHLTLLSRHLNDPHEYLRRDVDFHHAIMVASGNVFGQLIVRNVHAWIHEGPQPSSFTVKHIAESHRGHTAIMERIVERDGEGAAAAMRVHILQGWAIAKREILAGLKRDR
jgi:DNA-binding FadR family transcriptional regulator